MKLLKKFFLKFAKKLTLWFRGAYDEMKDQWNFWVVNDKIDSLNEELEWEDSGHRRTEILLELDLLSEAHNKILFRIRARDEGAELKQMVAR